MKRIISVIFSLAAINIGCHGQSCELEQKYGWIVPVRFQKPFVSEMESPLSKVEEGYGRAEEEYTPKEYSHSRYQPYLNVSLGITAPIWSAKLSERWSIGVDIPIHFHLWLDLNTVSAPVINTDYRFAVGEVKALYLMPKGDKWYNRYIKNISMRLAPLNHESTHIGDELTIRRKDQDYPITRVNVAYEYTEFAVCINDPNGTRLKNFAFKTGLMLRAPFSHSWFKIYHSDGDQKFDVKMRGVSEFYLQHEGQIPLKVIPHVDSDILWSVELRNRERYTYPTIKWDENANDWYLSYSEQRRAWCMNLYGGMKFFPVYDWMPNSIGVYLHGYLGIVPYGQFRNVGNYSYLGFSLVFEH